LHRTGEIKFNASETGDYALDQLAGGSASTGLGLGSYLLGLPATFGRYYTAYDYYPGIRQTRTFFYGQDAWRITPKLTMTYGLRWEDYLPQTAAKPGGIGSFDPATGEVLVAGVGNVPLDLGVQAYNKLFEPRFGIAYQATDKTVVRAGIHTFGTGLPFTPTVANAPLLNDPDFSQLRADVVGNPSVPNREPVVQCRRLQRTTAAVPAGNCRPRLAQGPETDGIRPFAIEEPLTE
jgi:outer membrane receptor protein involved in Fe transport